MGTLVYELPGEKEKVRKVLNFVPQEWSCADAHLFATRDHYENAKISGVRIGYYWDKESPIFSETDDLPFEDEDPNRKRRLFSFEESKTFEGELSSIYLNRLGINKPVMDVAFAKKLLDGFLEKGYKGVVDAVKLSEGYNDEKVYAERIKLSHFSELVLIDWNELFGGRKENLSAIINGLRELGLREVKP